MNKDNLVCVYRDTTWCFRYDKKNDNNLVYLEVAQDVALEYEKTPVAERLVGCLYGGRYDGLFDYAKDSIVGIYPA